MTLRALREMWAREMLCSGLGMMIGPVPVPVAALANPFLPVWIKPGILASSPGAKAAPAGLVDRTSALTGIESHRFAQ
jgi:hypothetical protein